MHPRPYPVRAVLIAVLAAVCSSAPVIPGDESSAGPVSYIQHVRISGPRGFYRADRLFSENEFGISAESKGTPAPFFRIHEDEIGLYHAGGDKTYTLIYAEGEKDTRPRDGGDWARSGTGLFLTVRILPHTHSMELSHKLAGSRGLDLLKLVESFDTGREVTRQWLHIDDNHNPFGRNRYFVSVYRGNLLCPEKGVYEFATDSCDGSLVLVGNRVAAEWGGLHKPVFGWTHSATLDLEPGLYPFIYIHYNITQGSRAAAAWKKPGEKSFSVLTAGDFFVLRDAETVSLRGSQGKEHIFPRITFEKNGIRLKGRALRKILFSAGGPEKQHYEWNINGVMHHNRTVSYYAETGGTVEYGLRGFPGKAFVIKVAEPDSYISADAEFDAGGVLPLIYTDEKYSVWVRAEREPASGDIAYILREDRVDSGGSVYYSNTYPLQFSKSGSLPASLMGIKSMQFVFKPGEVSHGSKVTYTLLYDGLEVNRLGLQFLSDTAGFEKIFVREKNYMTEGGGSDRICVFISEREREETYRKWVFFKWMKDAFSSKSPHILFVYEPLTSAGKLESVFKYNFRGFNVTAEKIDQQPYPLLQFPVAVEELMAKVPAETTVVLFAGRYEIENGLPHWFFTRVFDLTVTGIRKTNPRARIILAGPAPAYGKDELIERINTHLAEFALRHHIYFINLYREMGGKGGWQQYYSRGQREELFRSPNEKGLKLIVENIKDIVE